MEKRLFTSESVTEGHPDKMCDAISDAILDALMEQDPMSRVACETATTTGLVMVMGEITTKAYVDIKADWHITIPHDLLKPMLPPMLCVQNSYFLTPNVLADNQQLFANLCK